MISSVLGSTIGFWRGRLFDRDVTGPKGAGEAEAGDHDVGPAPPDEDGVVPAPPDAGGPAPPDHAGENEDGGISGAGAQGPTSPRTDPGASLPPRDVDSIRLLLPGEEAMEAQERARMRRAIFKNSGHDAHVDASYVRGGMKNGASRSADIEDAYFGRQTESSWWREEGANSTRFRGMRDHAGGADGGLEGDDDLEVEGGRTTTSTAVPEFLRAGMGGSSSGDGNKGRPPRFLGPTGELIDAKDQQPPDLHARTRKYRCFSSPVAAVQWTHGGPLHAPGRMSFEQEELEVFRPDPRLQLDLPDRRSPAAAAQIKKDQAIEERFHADVRRELNAPEPFYMFEYAREDNPCSVTFEEGRHEHRTDTFQKTAAQLCDDARRKGYEIVGEPPSGVVSAGGVLGERERQAARGEALIDAATQALAQARALDSGGPVLFYPDDLTSVAGSEVDRWSAGGGDRGGMVSRDDRPRPAPKAVSPHSLHKGSSGRRSSDTSHASSFSFSSRITDPLEARKDPLEPVPLFEREDREKEERNSLGGAFGERLPERTMSPTRRIKFNLQGLPSQAALERPFANREANDLAFGIVYDEEERNRARYDPKFLFDPEEGGGVYDDHDGWADPPEGLPDGGGRGEEEHGDEVVPDRPVASVHDVHSLHEQLHHDKADPPVVRQKGNTKRGQTRDAYPFKNLEIPSEELLSGGAELSDEHVFSATIPGAGPPGHGFLGAQPILLRDEDELKTMFREDDTTIDDLLSAYAAPLGADRLAKQRMERGKSPQATARDRRRRERVAFTVNEGKLPQLYELLFLSQRRGQLTNSSRVFAQMAMGSVRSIKQHVQCGKGTHRWGGHRWGGHQRVGIMSVGKGTNALGSCHRDVNGWQSGSQKQLLM